MMIVTNSSSDSNRYRRSDRPTGSLVGVLVGSDIVGCPVGFEVVGSDVVGALVEMAVGGTDGVAATVGGGVTATFA